MSKPRPGLYIKRHEKSRRQGQWSTRSAEGQAEWSPRSLEGAESEGYVSDVLVESYGEGNISADMDSNWPQHFESGQQIVENPVNPVPNRAQKYMVESQPIRDLTGAKYITVPDTRPAQVSGYNVHDHSNYEGHLSSTLHQQTIPRTLVPSSPRKEAGYHEHSVREPITIVPAGTLKGNSAKGKVPYFATVRLIPEKKKKSHIATIRVIPSSTVRSVKGYHLGYNTTVRGHNTGHLIKQVKQSRLPSWDTTDGTLGFHRTTTVPDRKEYCFSQFAVELDKPDKECYSPGEVMSGRIILEVNSNVEIRFVELLIIGLATLHVGTVDPAHTKDDQEMIISKRSYIMGNPDGRWNSVIMEGKYVSKFRFSLPKDIPSSIKYENKEHGLRFEIGYMVKARICDEIGSSSTRSTHSLNNLVKVLLSRKHPFFVRRPFDINAIPTAMKPVNHTDFINLNCLPVALDSAMLTLSLDRSVFLAGDIIRVKLTTSPGTARKIKHITCLLQMRMISSVKPKATYNLVQIDEHEPEPGLIQPNLRNTVSFDFMVPTHNQFISTYLQGCKLLKVSYYITMSVTFGACGGKLILEAPIGIGPCNDPQNIDKVGTTSVPIFNRPMRFPHFSKDNSNKIQNGMVHSGTRGNQATAERKNRGGTHLLCCVDD